MVRALFTAATGMKAQQMNIDNTANNLANVNTAGFKKGRVIFEDLMYQEIRSAGSFTAAGIVHPTGIQQGMGVYTVAIEKLFDQGSFQYTNEPMDIAIEHDGFFQVIIDEAGTIAYTRQGSFRRNADGDVVTPQGYYLEPRINIPDNARGLNISVDGIWTTMVDGDEVELGRTELARFINPRGLMAMGENIFMPTGASGEPQVAAPKTDGMGQLRQNFLEMSNVQVVDEMVNMITAQRAYEMDSKAIQTSDEMLQIANGLKR